LLDIDDNRTRRSQSLSRSGYRTFVGPRTIEVSRLVHLTGLTRRTLDFEWITVSRRFAIPVCTKWTLYASRIINSRSISYAKGYRRSQDLGRNWISSIAGFRAFFRTCSHMLAGSRPCRVLHADLDVWEDLARRSHGARLQISIS